MTKLGFDIKEVSGSIDISSLRCVRYDGTRVRYDGATIAFDMRRDVLFNLLKNYFCCASGNSFIFSNFGQMERGGCIYIMTNYTRTTYYTGVTSDLYARIMEHKGDKYPNSFTSRYKLKYCVYFEALFTIEEAIAREKQVKKYRREKKEALINSINPKWEDLWEIIKDWEAG